MQERFAVRTTYYNSARDELLHKTTIAEGRAQAIIHAERIGKIDETDRPRVRDFLEGSKLPTGYLCLTSGGASWDGVASIYQISE